MLKCEKTCVNVISLVGGKMNLNAFNIKLWHKKMMWSECTVVCVLGCGYKIYCFTVCEDNYLLTAQRQDSHFLSVDLDLRRSTSRAERKCIL